MHIREIMPANDTPESVLKTVSIDDIMSLADGSLKADAIPTLTGISSHRVRRTRPLGTVAKT